MSFKRALTWKSKTILGLYANFFWSNLCEWTLFVWIIQMNQSWKVYLNHKIFRVSKLDRRRWNHQQPLQIFVKVNRFFENRDHLLEIFETTFAVRKNFNDNSSWSHQLFRIIIYRCDNVWIMKLRISTFMNNGKLRWNLRNFIHYLRTKLYTDYLKKKLHPICGPFGPLLVPPSWSDEHPQFQWTSEIFAIKHFTSFGW
jgi:hypothetical protein